MDEYLFNFLKPGFRWLKLKIASRTDRKGHCAQAMPILFISLLGWMQIASADYTWIYSGPPHPSGSSAEAACHAEVEYQGNSLYNSNAPFFNYIYIKVAAHKSYSQKRCYINAYWKSNGSLQSSGFVLLNRYGDSCDTGKIYNKDIGGCDIPVKDAGQLCATQEGAESGNPKIIQTDGSCIELSKSPSQKGVNKLKGACSVDGNPIDFSSGNKFQADIDYRRPDREFEMGRFYNSIDGLWRYKFSTNLRISTTFIVLTLDDGREIYFNVEADVAVPSSTGLGGLQKVTGAWVYTDTSNNRFTFDVNGKLSRVEFSNGKFLKFSYDGMKIVVKDALGTLVTLTEDSQSQLLTLSATGLSIAYQYNSSSLLTKVTQTRNGQVATRTYQYEDARDKKLLTGITDERGVRYAAWSYDAKGRAISSEHAGGAEKILIDYNADGSSTVTNEFGKKTGYRFEVVQGVKRIVSVEGEPSANCPASNSTYIYDAQGQVLTKTDAKGFITTYTYNDRGLETSRTEATGTPQARTTTTTWHATFNLPLSVTEASQVTTYTYDAQGRQTSRTKTAL